jgi:hypothetical protein
MTGLGQWEIFYSTLCGRTVLQERFDLRQTAIAKSSTDKTNGERRGTLPLDLVVSQLEVSPKLLHWYLHLVFVRKPDIYVKFPNTANPPAAITILHRKHLELYIKYASEDQQDGGRGTIGWRNNDSTVVS